MTDLEKLIADSLAESDARKARREAEEEARKARHEALLNSVIEDARARLAASDSIPFALRDHVTFIGGQPSESQLRLFPDSWIPEDFLVSAPGLDVIHFEVRHNDEGGLRVWRILVDGRLFDTDWTEAIADARRRVLLEQELSARAQYEALRQAD